MRGLHVEVWVKQWGRRHILRQEYSEFIWHPKMERVYASVVDIIRSLYLGTHEASSPVESIYQAGAYICTICFLANAMI
jgi:hypothetical protein